jgi:hypothetical protein
VQALSDEHIISLGIDPHIRPIAITVVVGTRGAGDAGI